MFVVVVAEEILVCENQRMLVSDKHATTCALYV